jgi:hypothetical protein
MRSGEALDVFDRCHTLETGWHLRTLRLTLGENLPLAGLAARGVWQDVVQLIEQALHLTSPLPLGHLVAYAKLWRSTVVARLGRIGSWSGALQACDTAVLHRVMMSRRDV